MAEQMIPQELRESKQWAAYRTYYDSKKGKRGKAILNVADGHFAKSNDPSTWTDYETARAYAKANGCKGVSFALTRESNITCIDLDGCFDDTGAPSKLAREMLELFPETYTERSVSGKGLHIFVRGDMTENGRYYNRTETPEGEIEAYCHGRFISMTGNSINGVQTIAQPTAASIRRLHGMMKERPKPVVFQNASKYLADDRTVIERIQKSRKADEYNALARGENVTGDRSRNDWAMAKIVGFFSGGDVQQTVRIMRSSGLNRPEKPDVYYERTAQNAVNTLTSRYGDAGRGWKKPQRGNGSQCSIFSDAASTVREP